MMGKKPHYFGLDVIRWIAACMVAMLHLTTATISNTGLYQTVALANYSDINLKIFGSTLPPFIYTGSLGVQVFFVISGFVIALSVGKAKSIREFIYKRILRLLPILWVASFLSFIIAITSGYVPLIQAVPMLIRSLLLSPIGSHIDDVVWTLVLEVIFYILVAVVCLNDRVNGVFKVGLYLTMMSFAYWLIFYVNKYIGIACITDVYENRFVVKITALMLVQHGCYFGLGIAVYSMSKSIGKSNVLIFIIGFFTSIMQVAWTGDYYAMFYGKNGASLNNLLEISVWIALFALIIVSILFVYPIQAILIKWTVFVRAIGMGSYPLYLIHISVGSTVLGLTAILNPYISIASSVLCVMLFALIMSIYIEPKVKSLMSNFSINFSGVRGG